MPTFGRALVAASVIMLCAACEEEKPPPVPVATVAVPAKPGEAAAACGLRAVVYRHGKLKDTFLVGKETSDPLRRHAVFSKRRLRVNTDGAENSYHSDRINADDRSVGAVNIICNAGVRIYPHSVWNFWGLLVRPQPVECYASSRISVEPRYMELYKAIKDNDWRPAQGHSIGFNWSILGRNEPQTFWPWRLFARERPCVNPEGFFVSKTKITRYVPKDACDQRAYLDSNEGRAVVLPQHWFADWRSPQVARWASFLPGDVVVAYRPADRGQPETWVFGIVGDAGPLDKFGEATMAFNWQLMGKTGSIREQIRTYKDALSLDTDTIEPHRVSLLVLEGTAPALGGDYSAANIEVRAREAFAEWGGETRFKACLEAMP
jgi:hypothetical protein